MQAFGIGGSRRKKPWCSRFLRRARRRNDKVRNNADIFQNAHSAVVKDIRHRRQAHCRCHSDAERGGGISFRITAAFPNQMQRELLSRRHSLDTEPADAACMMYM